MIEYSECSINQLSVHKVGNKTNDEELYLSKAPLDNSDDKLEELLIRFFLQPFPGNEFFNFTFSNDDFNLNPLFAFSSAIFENSNTLHLNSENIAKHLFEISDHPNIKSGDLFVAHFSDIYIDDEKTDAVGIFKSENRQAFLQISNETNDFSLKYDDGINVEKLDKGCLIFNTSKEEGYKICILDKSNKSFDARYWKEGFLNIKSCNDSYHDTKEFLNITKNFVAKQVSEEFEVSKADKIDLLNRSVDYFKTHEDFDKKEFEKEVFHDENMIDSFRKYDDNYREDKGIDINENFEISAPAVKKQARIFKSVLKLDKNFHIYIHGNKSLIEQGIDNDGRKFYKIYYDKEQ